MILVQEPLDFHLLFADTMGFIPVQFRFPDMAAWKPHLRHAFKFSPAAATELFLEPHNIPDAAPMAMVSISPISPIISKYI